MPKFAATLASLLLIGSSIGVNIARYPQVGRTVDAGQPTDAAQPVNSAPVAQPSSLVETANRDSLPASETKIEPKSPQVVPVAPGENTRVEEPLPAKPAGDAVRPQPLPAATILDVRPMVPIGSLPAAAGEADPPASSDEVQRLPPVEPGVSAIREIQPAETDGTQAYTATSTP